MTDPAPIDFRTVFQHAPVPMAVVTRRGLTVVAANRAAGLLLGLDPSQIAGRALSSYREDHGAISIPDVVSDQRDQAALVGEFPCRRRDGTTVWLEVRASTMPPGDVDAGGRALCLLHLLDVTRRRTEAAERARREAWASALGEIRMAVMRGATTARALGLVCRSARALLDADDAVVIIPATDGATAWVRAADGQDAHGLIGASVPLRSTVAGQVLARGLPVVAGGDSPPGSVIDGRLPSTGTGAVLAIPLRTPEVVLGALCLLRSSDRPFGDGDVAVAHSFADQAAAALHIGVLREARERLRVMEDRERIARDLHDSVIQDLFAAGMALDAIQPLIGPAEAAERVAATIDQLDATIKQIRSTIFELEIHDPTLRVADMVRRAVEGRAEQLGFTPGLEVTGDLDDTPAGLVDHMLAVISESLSNVMRHSGARSAGVEVSITPGGALTLVIEDDGGGFDPTRVPRGRGLDNMHRRAGLVGGRLSVTRSPTGGTRVMLETQPGPRLGGLTEGTANLAEGSRA